MGTGASASANHEVVKKQAKKFEEPECEHPLPTHDVEDTTSLLDPADSLEDDEELATLDASTQTEANLCNMVFVPELELAVVNARMPVFYFFIEDDDEDCESHKDRELMTDSAVQTIASLASHCLLPVNDFTQTFSLPPPTFVAEVGDNIANEPFADEVGAHIAIGTSTLPKHEDPATTEQYFVTEDGADIAIGTLPKHEDSPMNEQPFDNEVGANIAIGTLPEHEGPATNEQTFVPEDGADIAIGTLPRQHFIDEASADKTADKVYVIGTFALPRSLVYPPLEVHAPTKKWNKEATEESKTAKARPSQIAMPSPSRT